MPRRQWHERLSLHFKKPVCVILEQELKRCRVKGSVNGDVGWRQIVKGLINEVKELRFLSLRNGDKSSEILKPGEGTGLDLGLDS